VSTGTALNLGTVLADAQGMIDTVVSVASPPGVGGLEAFGSGVSGLRRELIALY
jgi:hypothetical protein